jgi:hypothetical protein
MTSSDDVAAGEALKKPLAKTSENTRNEGKIKLTRSILRPSRTQIANKIGGSQECQQAQPATFKSGAKSATATWAVTDGLSKPSSSPNQD